MTRFRNVNLCCRLILTVLVFLPAFVEASWQNVGNVTRVKEIKANGAVLQTSSGGCVLVEFFDINVVRVRLAPSGVFERNISYAIQSLDRRSPSVKITRTAHEIILTADDGAKVSVKKSPLSITIFDANGEKVLEDGGAAIFDSETGEIRAVKRRHAENETYYGFGEKTLPFSRDSQTMVMWNTDTYRYTVNQDLIYQDIPFFIALSEGKAYGLFFHNTFRSNFDMGKSAPRNFSFGATGGELDYFVFTGGKERTPAKILEDYSKLTGRTPLPPIWALGNQQSRFSYTPQARVLEVADEFRKRQIPSDVIYIDIDHMDGFRVFTWNKQTFPNPKLLIGDLAKIGFRAITIVDPAVKVDENYRVYTDGRASDAFVKNADGSEFNGSVWAGKSAFPDFTKPQTREWFGLQYQKYLDDGVSGFWNDMNEPSVFPEEKDNAVPLAYSPFKTVPLDARHNGEGVAGTHARFHNVYGMQMARATFEGVRKLQPEKRPFVLARAGFAGIQRFAAVWTGDNTASWEHLRLSIPMLLNLSVSGVPFVGADVGGYSDMPGGELYSRWLQAAALTPFLRSHSENNLPDKEPWAYGDGFEKINRASIELRYQFLPYLYTLFREHEKNGKPVMRPLWFEYPKNPKTYLIDDEFLIGRDLLVAPVVKDGQRKRQVYFPAGDDWRDWETGEIYKGGNFAEIAAPLEKLPLFARVGAVIPTQSIIQHTGEMSNAPLKLNVITGIALEKIETATVFQDAGDGYGYRQNKWRELHIEHRRGLLRLTSYGDFENARRIRFVEAVGFPVKPREIRVGGTIFKDAKFDQKKMRLQIELTGVEPKEISLIP